MSSDRETLLLHRQQARQTLKNPDAPQPLLDAAKRLKDSSEALLGLQDAQARKEERQTQQDTQERKKGWFSESFSKNPVAWVMFGLFLLAEYGNYTIGQDLNRVCDLLGDHAVSMSHPRTARDEIDNICIAHEPVGSSDDP